MLIKANPKQKIMSNKIAATILNLRKRSRCPNIGTNSQLSLIAGVVYWTQKTAACKPFAHAIFDTLSKANLVKFVQKLGVSATSKTTTSELLTVIKKQQVTTLRPLVLEVVLPSLELDWANTEVFLGISTSMRRELADETPSLVSRYGSGKYGKYPIFSASKVIESAWKIVDIKAAFLAQVEERISAKAVEAAKVKKYAADVAASKSEATAYLDGENLSANDRLLVNSFIETQGAKQLSAAKRWCDYRTEAIAASSQYDEEMRLILVNARLCCHLTIQKIVSVFGSLKTLQLRLGEFEVVDLAAVHPRDYHRTQQQWSAKLNNHAKNSKRTAKKSAVSADIRDTSAHLREVYRLTEEDVPLILRIGSNLVINPSISTNAIHWCSLTIASKLYTVAGQKRFNSKRFDIETLEDALFSDPALLKLQGVTDLDLVA